jgi:hypothetical protein
MRPIPAFPGVVTPDGLLHLDSRSLFDRYVRTLKNQPVTVTVKKQGRPKSRNQLGFLYAAIYPVIADELGYMDYEIPALHDACMREVIGLRPDPNPLKLRASLAEMDHELVSNYITELRFFALDKLGIVTPDPEKENVA